MYCRTVNFNFDDENELFYSSFKPNLVFETYFFQLLLLEISKNFQLMLDFIWFNSCFSVLTISDMVFSCCCVKSMMIHDLQPLHNSFMSLKPLDRIEAVNIMHLLYIHFAFDFHTQTQARCLSVCLYHRPTASVSVCVMRMSNKNMYEMCVRASRYRQCFNNWQQYTFQRSGHTRNSVEEKSSAWEWKREAETARKKQNRWIEARSI